MRKVALTDPQSIELTVAKEPLTQELTKVSKAVKSEPQKKVKKLGKEAKFISPDLQTYSYACSMISFGRSRVFDCASSEHSHATVACYEEPNSESSDCEMSWEQECCLGDQDLEQYGCSEPSMRFGVDVFFDCLEDDQVLLGEVPELDTFFDCQELD